MQYFWIALHLFAFVCGRDVYISKAQEENDEIREGNITRPCYDFKYFSSAEESETVTFFLDGQNDTQLTYVLDQYITGPGRVNFRSYHNSKHKPILILKIYAFHMKKNQVSFSDLSILYGNISFMTRDSGKVSFKNCHINSSKFIFDSSNCAKTTWGMAITIDESVLTEVTIEIKSNKACETPIRLNITNTVIQHYHTKHDVIVSEASSIYIGNCTFTNINGARLLRAYDTSLRMFESVVMGNTFTDDLRSRPFYFSNKGSVISVIGGSISVSNCVFTNNIFRETGLFFGGYLDTTNISSSLFSENRGKKNNNCQLFYFYKTKSIEIISTELTSNQGLSLFKVRFGSFHLKNSLLAENDPQKTNEHFFFVFAAGPVDWNNISVYNNYGEIRFEGCFQVKINHSNFDGNNNIKGDLIVIRVIPCYRFKIYDGSCLNFAITHTYFKRNNGRNLINLIDLIPLKLFFKTSRNIYISSCIMKMNTFQSLIQIKSKDLLPSTTITNITVENNTYQNFVVLLEGSLVFINSKIRNNKASSSDLYIRTTRLVSISDVTFERQEENILLEGKNIADIDGEDVKLSLRRIHFYLSHHQLKAFKINLNKKAVSLLEDVRVICPQGMNPKGNEINVAKGTLFTYFCQACETRKYSLQRGNITFNSTNLYQKKESATCLECPVGSLCHNGRSVSGGNTFGQIVKNSIKYITCPEGYCCPKYCNSYKQCAKNRKGLLCGNCKDKYQVDIYSTKCTKKEQCTKPFLFWFIFVTTPGVFVLFFMFTDVIAMKLRQLFHYLKQMNSIKKNFCCKNIDRNEEREEFTLTTKHKVYRQSDEVNEQISSDVQEIHRDVKKSETIENTPLHFSSDTTNDTYEPDNNETLSLNEQTDQASTKTYTLSGIFNILVAYFQIKSLLAVDESFTPRSIASVSKIISNIFDAEIFNMASSICPNLRVTTVRKYFLKMFLFNVLMPVYVLVIICIYCLVKLLSPNKHSIRAGLKYGVHKASFIRNKNYRFIHRLSTTYIKTLMFIYKNVAIFSLSMISCVKIEKKLVLFIQGDIECYQRWQITIMFFLAFWILPFPFCLERAYRMFKNHQITSQELMISLSMPIALPCYVISRRWFCKRSTVKVHKIQHMMLDQLFIEPYRLEKGSNDRFIFWEHWRLIQRLALAAVVSFVSNPLRRIVALSPCILCYALIYILYKPYKETLKLLHRMEAVSIIGFSFLLLKNNFNSFLFLYEISPEGISVIMIAFNCMEWLFNPLTFLIFYFVCLPCFYKVKNVLRMTRK